MPLASWTARHGTVPTPGATMTSESQAQSGKPALALVLATLAFTLCFAVWGLISPLAPLFRERYHLSGTEIGLLVGLPVVLGSLGRIPMGLLADLYGGRAVFTVLLLILLAPVAVIGFTGSYVGLLVVSFFLGLAGAAFAVGIPFVAAWFPPARQGFALGIYGVGNFGTAIAARAKEVGFTVSRATVEIAGLCPNCRAQAR